MCERKACGRDLSCRHPPFPLDIHRLWVVPAFPASFLCGWRLSAPSHPGFHEEGCHLPHPFLCLQMWVLPPSREGPASQGHVPAALLLHFLPASCPLFTEELGPWLPSFWVKPMSTQHLTFQAPTVVGPLDMAVHGRASMASPDPFPFLSRPWPVESSRHPKHKGMMAHEPHLCMLLCLLIATSSLE